MIVFAVFGLTGFELDAPAVLASLQ